MKNALVVISIVMVLSIQGQAGFRDTGRRRFGSLLYDGCQRGGYP